MICKINKDKEIVNYNKDFRLKPKVFNNLKLVVKLIIIVLVTIKYLKIKYPNICKPNIITEYFLKIL